MLSPVSARRTPSISRRRSIAVALVRVDWLLPVAPRWDSPAAYSISRARLSHSSKMPEGICGAERGFGSPRVGSYSTMSPGATPFAASSSTSPIDPSGTSRGFSESERM